MLRLQRTFSFCWKLHWELRPNMILKAHFTYCIFKHIIYLFLSVWNTHIAPLTCEDSRSKPLEADVLFYFVAGGIKLILDWLKHNIRGLCQLLPFYYCSLIGFKTPAPLRPPKGCQKLWANNFLLKSVCHKTFERPLSSKTNPVLCRPCRAILFTICL